MPGGWEGFKEFRVIKKVAESENISSFYLVPADGSILPNFKAGQYITLRVGALNGLTTMRNYSLSDISHGKWFRISVKREGRSAAEPEIEGYVSTLLHESVDVGAILELAPPAGEFFLDFESDQTRPLVLVAAGVGITPIYPMLLTALKTWPQRKIIFIHGVLNRRVQAFETDLSVLAGKHSNLEIHFRYSEEGFDASENASVGLIDSALLDKMLPEEEAEFYFCGPKAFMSAFHKELECRGIPATNIHFEFFGPKQNL